MVTEGIRVELSLLTSVDVHNLSRTFFPYPTVVRDFVSPVGGDFVASGILSSSSRRQH